MTIFQDNSGRLSIVAWTLDDRVDVEQTLATPLTTRQFVHQNQPDQPIVPTKSSFPAHPKDGHLQRSTWEYQLSRHSRRRER